MDRWELLVAIKDIEGKRKAGDIIDYKKYPHNWGRKEVDQYLVIPIENLSSFTLARFISPLYDNSKYPDEMTDEEMHSAAIVKKRRHCFPLDILKTGWYPSMDLDRVADPTDVYQPLKDNGIFIDFDEHVKNVLDKVDDSFRYDAEKEG